MIFQHIYNHLALPDLTWKCAANLGLELFSEQKRIVVKSWFRFLEHFICYAYDMVAMLFFVFKYLNDVDEIAESVWLLTTGFILMVKLMIFGYNMPRLRKLKIRLENIPRDDNNLKFFFVYGGDRAEEHDLWKKYNHQGNFLVTIYYYACQITIFTIFSRPLLVCLVSYIQDGTIVLNPPLKGLYPYNTDKLINYMFTYYTDWKGVSLARDCMVVVDGSFCWNLFATSSHFGILRMKIKRLGENISKQEPTEKLLRQFRVIFQYHQKVLKLGKEFDSGFSLITFAMTFLCVLPFCFIFYLMGIQLDIITRVYLLTAFLLFIFQIAIYCFGGEKIQNENELLAKEIYLSMPIELMDHQIKRTYLLFLKQCQLKVQLTGGSFFVANRNLFVKVLKTAYSYAALVDATNK